MKTFIFFVILSIISIVWSKCIVNENYCTKCNPLTDLCSLCTKLEVLNPDDKGGCKGNKQCKPGKNYCFECNESNELCTKCDISYYPDENGGCSSTNFCKISYKGECLECSDDFILVGEESNFKFCKSKLSDDFLNCEKINTKKGECRKCNEGYFLNRGDRKCTKTENCTESIFGNCEKCISGYYYNKKENKCIEKNDNLLFCKQVLDGEICDICDDYHYLDENGQCTFTNFCSESEGGRCTKCIDGYHLTYDDACSDTDNCFYSDRDNGVCSTCDTHYYLDKEDYKCKTNLENNEFLHCTEAEGGICTTCEYSYQLGSDLKCSNTRFCKESENGICTSCIENFYLGLDNNCAEVEHCIYSWGNNCTQCEEGFYYNKHTRQCLEQKDSELFTNCKSSNIEGNICGECEDDYYLRKNDSLCFSNTDKESNLYKCAYGDETNEGCEKCVEGYFVGREDKKCSLIEDCAISKDEFTCIKCAAVYCLDVKEQKCVDNEKIEDENVLIYFKCNRTNEEGTECEECVEGFEVGEEGHCINMGVCEEEKDGICMKCKDNTKSTLNGYCSNKVFGCMEIIYNKFCLRCDDIFNFNNCTECQEGYNKTFYGGCRKDSQ